MQPVAQLAAGVGGGEQRAGQGDPGSQGQQHQVGQVIGRGWIPRYLMYSGMKARPIRATQAWPR